MLDLQLTNKTYEFGSDNKVLKTIAIVQSSKPFVLFHAELEGDHRNTPDAEVIELAKEWITKQLFFEEYIDKKLIEINSVVKEAVETIDKLREETKAIKVAQSQQAETILLTSELTDEQRQVMLGQFPHLEIGKVYEAGEILNYNGKLYKVIQNHRSQSDWFPDSTPALYTEFRNAKTVVESTDPDTGEIIEEEVEVISDFVQPTGAHDSYKLGDKVRFNEKIYESLIDNNAYSPETYPQGWKEV